MSEARRLPLLRLALLALIAVSVYGFWSNALFEQYIWSPLGLRRLGWAAALYAAPAAAVIGWKPTLAPPVFGLFLAAYAGAAVGPAAPLAVLFFLCSSLFLGRFFLRTDEPLDYLQALLLGLGIWIWLIGAAARFPVNTPLVYLIAFALPIAAGWRFVPEFYRAAAERLRTAPPPAPLSRAALWLLLFLLLVHYLVALKPEAGADGLAMHMVIASRLAAHSLWPFDVQQFVWAVMPMGGDWAFSGAYLLGGEYAARLMNFSFLVLLALMLHAGLRDGLRGGAPLLLTALFASTPLVLLASGSLLVENVWAAFVLGAVLALWRYHATRRSAYLFLLGAFLGCAAHVKYGSLALLPAALALALPEWRKARRLGRASSLTLPIFLALLAVFAAPPYLTAYYHTGNPVFPFLNDLFQSPWYDTAVRHQDGRWPQGVEWNMLYKMTFHSQRYLEAQAGSFGFHYLLLPLGFLLLPRKPAYLASAALAMSLCYWLLTCQYIVYLRYVYPVLPLFMLGIGWVFAEARRADPGLCRALYAAAVGMIFLNVYFAPASGWRHGDFFVNHFDPAGESSYRDAYAPARRLVDYLNAEAPGAGAAFLTEGAPIASLEAPVVAAHWHYPEFLRKLSAADSTPRILSLAKELGIEYFIVPTSLKGLQSRFPSLPAFIHSYTVPEISSGPYYLARLEPGRPVDLRRRPPGRYDDRDDAVIYSGPWTSSDSFDETVHDTVTYSNKAQSLFRFAFQGNEVRWVYTKAFNRGMAAVAIDGRRRATIDLYSAEIEWRAGTTFSGLGEGPHELEVRVLGIKNPAASDRFVDVDLLVVK